MSDKPEMSKQMDLLRVKHYEETLNKMMSMSVPEAVAWIKQEQSRSELMKDLTKKTEQLNITEPK